MTGQHHTLGTGGPFTQLWLDGPSATMAGRETDEMFIWLWWFCVVWFVGLMALMAYWVVKYRRRPGKIAPMSPSHNTRLEIAWTVIPSLFLVYMFFKGFKGYIGQLLAPGDAIVMNVTGAKWYWQLTYPNGAESPATARPGAKDIPVFYFPAKTNIQLKMQSKDVLHAFWVPDFRVKQDVIPNRFTTLWFNAEGPGPGAAVHPTPSEGSAEAKRTDVIALAGVPYTEHILFCAEYCGTEHSEMAALIRIVPDDAYRRWVEAIGTPSDPVELGRKQWRLKCASCHTIDGSPNTGPTWLNAYGATHEMTNGEQVTVDDAYILESIMEPSKRVVKGFENGNMPSFRGLLTPTQVDGIIQFMKSISDKAGTDGAAPAAESAPTP
ncbi:MAG: cytochrome c oxidase subunit II [Planctomycetota bacterium]|nr:cytochrome c oxidase subunit II [Planctomycetota bacterium]